MEAQNYTITGLKAMRENLVSQRSPAENSWCRRAHPAENSWSRRAHPAENSWCRRAHPAENSWCRRAHPAENSWSRRAHPAKSAILTSLGSHQQKPRPQGKACKQTRQGLQADKTILSWRMRIQVLILQTGHAASFYAFSPPADHSC
jgi:hypothetical protein